MMRWTAVVTDVDGVTVRVGVIWLVGGGLLLAVIPGMVCPAGGA